MKTSAHLLPALEVLESRIVPAVHTWTGLGGNALWSNGGNWSGGSPGLDITGDIDLIFPNNAINLVMQNDIVNLTVDSITFTAPTGTSANGYTFNGNALTMNTGAAGQDPFGIDLNSGVASLANGITETFNLDLKLATTNATFRSQDVKAVLAFHGDIDLGGRTLTFDNTTGGGNNATIQGALVDGDISNGSLVKTGSGTLVLSGQNTYANATVNGGFIIATTDAALGGAAGVLTANDPGQFQLRNGITVVKTMLTLNSNSTGGGIGADGGTTNIFRGAITLMAGNGGVAVGAGFGAANAATRLILDGVISGATSTLFINGSGVVELKQSNTFTGQTNLNGNQGPSILQVDTPTALGAGGGGNEIIISSGNSLLLNFSGTLATGGVGENIQMAGAGVGGNGAVRVLGGNDVVLSGSITFIAGAPWTFGVDSLTDSITTTGVIDSQANLTRALTKVGSGPLIISGAGANTFGGGVVVKAGTLEVQNTTGTPLGNAGALVFVNSGGTLLVDTGVNVPNDVILSGGTLSGTGTVPFVSGIGGTVAPGGTDTGRLFASTISLDADSTFSADIHGTTVATDYDQLHVTAGVVLGGAKLALTDDFAAAPNTQFILIDNTSSSAVSGTFAGLPQGAKFSLNGLGFQISYTGGTGNDVVLTALATPASDLAIIGTGKSATFTDVDGDLVTVKLTGATASLTAADFTFGFSGTTHPQLLQLKLDAADAGATLTITSKRTAAGGDGFTNVGYLQATGIALGAVTVDGDLGRIDAGAVKALTVQSLGALGLASQGAGGTLVSNLSGNLGKLTVKASIHGATVLGAGSIGPVKITGSFLGGRLSAGADLGAVSVRGDIIGTASAPVIISGLGKAVAPTKGVNLAIKSLTVSGGVDSLRVLAGYNLSLAARNADASIGAITVGADWRAGTVLAGVTGGADGFAGTADDAKIAGGGVQDAAAVFSTIAGLTIKGQAYGSTAGADAFGIVAEQITKAKVGKALFKLDKGPRDAADAFALAATGPGPGNPGLASDFFLREVTL